MTSSSRSVDPQNPTLSMGANRHRRYVETANASYGAAVGFHVGFDYPQRPPIPRTDTKPDGEI